MTQNVKAAIENLEIMLKDPAVWKAELRIWTDEQFKCHLELKHDGKVMIGLCRDELLDLISIAGQDAANIIKIGE